jgi:hypothetical protein
MYLCSFVKRSLKLSDLRKIEMTRQCFINFPIIKLNQNHRLHRFENLISFVLELFHAYGQIDRRTDAPKMDLQDFTSTPCFQAVAMMAIQRCHGSQKY